MFNNFEHQHAPEVAAENAEEAWGAKEQRMVDKLKTYIQGYKVFTSDIVERARLLANKCYGTPEQLVQVAMEQYLEEEQHPLPSLVDSYAVWKAEQMPAPTLTEEDIDMHAKTVCEWLLNGTYDDNDAALRDLLGPAGGDDKIVAQILDSAYTLYEYSAREHG